jgi:hypothetical protein
MYSILVGKPEGRRPLGRQGCTWEDGFRLDRREMVWGGGGWRGFTR